MFNNVSESRVPDEELIPDFIFAHPEFDWAHNTDHLNITEYVLDERVDNENWHGLTAIHDVDNDRDITFEQLQTQVDTLGNALRQFGITPGTRVLCQFDNTPSSIYTVFALWKIGAILVGPCSPAHGKKEIEYLIEDGEVSAVISSDKNVDQVIAAVDEAEGINDIIISPTVDSETPTPAGVATHGFTELMADTEPDVATADTAPLDVAAIMYTGGTTGRPKGCITTHASFVAGAILTTKNFGLDGSDIYYTNAPMGHAFAMYHRTLGMYRGSSIVSKTRPDTGTVLDIIDNYSVSVFGSAPTFWRMCFKKEEMDEYDLSSLRLVYMSGERLEPETADTLANYIGFEPGNVVGMVPLLVSPFLTSFEDGRTVAPGVSVGKQQPGFEIKVVDENDEEVNRGEMGRLAVRGPVGITYWQNKHPDVESRQKGDTLDGWSVTDDLYRIDEDGWLWFEARADDMIVSSGRQIAAPEVEEVIAEHPSVSEVGVVAKPDDVRGNIVKAYVSTTADASSSGGLKAEIQDFVKSRMALYKYPREVEFIEELPMDNVGKIQRRELRELARDS